MSKTPNVQWRQNMASFARPKSSPGCEKVSDNHRFLWRTKTEVVIYVCACQTPGIDGSNDTSQHNSHYNAVLLEFHDKCDKSVKFPPKGLIWKVRP